MTLLIWSLLSGQLRCCYDKSVDNLLPQCRSKPLPQASKLRFGRACLDHCIFHATNGDVVHIASRIQIFPPPHAWLFVLSWLRYSGVLYGTGFWK